MLTRLALYAWLLFAFGVGFSSAIDVVCLVLFLLASPRASALDGVKIALLASTPLYLLDWNEPALNWPWPFLAALGLGMCVDFVIGGSSSNSSSSSSSSSESMS